MYFSLIHFSASCVSLKLICLHRLFALGQSASPLIFAKTLLRRERTRSELRMKAPRPRPLRQGCPAARGAPGFPRRSSSRSGGHLRPAASSSRMKPGLLGRGWPASPAMSPWQREEGQGDGTGALGCHRRDVLQALGGRKPCAGEGLRWQPPMRAGQGLSAASTPLGSPANLRQALQHTEK